MGWGKSPGASEWFQVGASAVLVDGYTGRQNTVPIIDTQGLRSPIELLFPEYNDVVMPAPGTGLFETGPLAGFHLAFIAAWKANKEYALNGQKCQPDATVLQHCILVWNRAHVSSSTTLLSPSTAMYQR